MDPTAVFPRLVIKTSRLTDPIALTVADELSGCSREEAGRRHAQALTREIRELLSEQQVTPRDLAGVGVSLGRGSLTGLRGGVMCAMMLTDALRCPVMGVETFRVIAKAATTLSGRISAMKSDGVAEGRNGSFPRSRG